MINIFGMHKGLHISFKMCTSYVFSSLLTVSICTKIYKSCIAIYIACPTRSSFVIHFIITIMPGNHARKNK